MSSFSSMLEEVTGTRKARHRSEIPQAAVLRQRFRFTTGTNECRLGAASRRSGGILPPMTPHGKSPPRSVHESLSDVAEVTVRARSCLDTLE